jgi:hypothetical protein
MSGLQFSRVSLRTVLRENGKLVVFYGLEAVVVGMLWWPLALVAAFSLFGFVIFPYVSRDVCLTCENAKNCPRHRRRFLTLECEGLQVLWRGCL